MSARQPFFPQAPARPESRPTFVPDPTSSLHAGAKPPGSFGAQQPEQPRRSLNNPFSAPRRQPEAPISNNTNKPATSGLGMLKKRSSAAADKGVSGTAMGHVIRPGTADPHSRTFHSHGPNISAPQPPIVAPVPQMPPRTSPTLLAQNASSFTGSTSPMAFKVPLSSNSNAPSDSNAEINAHTSTLDATLSFKAPMDGFAQNIKFRPASRANGPQRVPIDQGPSMLNPYANGRASVLENSREMTVNDRLNLNPTRQTNKRSRDEVDEDENDDCPPGNQAKRFKSHDQNESSREHNVRNKTRSPNSTDRPSSGLSRSTSRAPTHQGTDTRTSPDVHRPAAPEYHPQGLDMNSPPAFKGYSQYDVPLPQATPEPRALEKLLGTDPDAYVKGHMDVYDEMIDRWANCTIEEWKAGADEIAAEYHKLLDYVKIYVETKLKLYGSFHDNVRTHNVTLDRRKQELEGARKKLVKESRMVLN